MIADQELRLGCKERADLAVKTRRMPLVAQLVDRLQGEDEIEWAPGLRRPGVGFEVRLQELRSPAVPAQPTPAQPGHGFRKVQQRVALDRGATIEDLLRQEPGP